LKDPSRLTRPDSHVCLEQRFVYSEAAAHRCLHGVWTEHCRADTFKVVLSKIQTHLNYTTQLCSHADTAKVVVRGSASRVFVQLDVRICT